MRKRILAFIMVLVLAGACSLGYTAPEIKASAAPDEGNTRNGTTGAVSEADGINFHPERICYSGNISDVKWGIDSSGVFAFYYSDAEPRKRISLSSGFSVYKSPEEVPWHAYRSKIRYVTMANLDSFMSMGAMDYFFYKCENLKGVVMLPTVASSMTKSFYGDKNMEFFGCTAPFNVSMDSCFEGCTSLKSDVVLIRELNSCKNAFKNTSCNVVMLPEVYNKNVRMMQEAGCQSYYCMNDYELTLSGISRTNGNLINDYSSYVEVPSLRYGQKLSEAVMGTGSSGGVRLAYSYGPTNFLHSVYIACTVSKGVLNSAWNEERVLGAGTYSKIMDAKLGVAPSGMEKIQVSEYTGSSYADLVVEQCPLSECSFAISDSGLFYDGSVKKPDFKLTNPYNGEVLSPGTDYDATYQNAVNAGTATIKVTGKGNYTGTVSRNYTIGKVDMTVSAANYEGTYDGAAHGIQVGVTKPAGGYTIRYGTSSGNCNLTASPTYRDVGTYTVYYQVTAENYKAFTGSARVEIRPKNIADCSVAGPGDETYNGKDHTPEVAVIWNGKRLAAQSDYTVEYRNNRQAGKAEITIRGKGNYTGSKDISFEIRPLKFQVTTDNSDGFVRAGDVVYNGTTQNPELLIRLGGGRLELQEGTDYVITGNRGTEAGIGTVTVSGKGNFEGVVSLSYSILPFQMGGHPEKMVLKDTEMTYTGAELHPEVSIWNTGGELLIENQDYVLSYSNAVETGTAEVKAEFRGNYSGSIVKTFYIKPAQVELVELSQEEFIYSGKEQTPTAKGYREGVDYQVEYRDNINVGKALAVFSFQGNYTGTVTKEFEIFPRRVTGELVFPHSERVTYGSGMTVSELPLSETGNVDGVFRWQDPEEKVLPDAVSYSVEFIPIDVENYDWSGVPGWDAERQVVVRSIPVVIVKEEKPSATGKPTEEGGGAGKPTEEGGGAGKPSEGGGGAGKPSEEGSGTGNIPGSENEFSAGAGSPGTELTESGSGEIDNAYQTIEKMITAKVLAGIGHDGEGSRATVYAPQKIRGIATKWLKKKRTRLRVKKGSRIRLRLKGVSGKKKIKWNSSRKKIASVNKKGIVKANKKGIARITARVGHKKFICRLVVRR